MSEASLREKAHALFESIVELGDDAREAVLQEQCAGQPELRALVEALLAADGAPHRLLDSDPSDLMPLLEDVEDPPGAEPIGTMIGGYRLVREAGRGGMATVYLAEREVGGALQRVALKLVKRGIDTAEVLRRFQHETRVLASLEHPNIARFYDAGASEDGRPYFTMEYIEGRSLTEHCDEARLSVAERLKLFRAVCEAVEYAHQRLVVHRDIKPSNILVTEGGELKLLDFGIAKLLTEDADPRAPHTRTGMLVLTPEYASPEQLRGEPVDTAADVFALGLVLYELLAGRRARAVTPSPAPPRYPGSSPDPPAPSSAVRRATRERTADGIAAARRTTPDRLRRLLRGDLDRIVLKAIENDAALRYRSAEQLLADLDRYERGRPVRARPNTLPYRFGKYVRRHRAGVGAAVGASLLTVGFGTYHAVRITAERDRAQLEAAKAQATTTFLEKLLSDAYPSVALGDTFSMADLLRRATARVDSLAAQPEIQAELLRTLGDIYREQGHYKEAAPLLERAVALQRTASGPAGRGLADALSSLGELRYDLGDYGAARAAHVESLDVYRRSMAEDDSMVLYATNNVATAEMRLGHVEEALRLFREVLARSDRLFADTSQLVHVTHNNLGVLLSSQGNDSAAVREFSEALRIRRLALPADHPAIALTENNLATSLSRIGRLEEAEHLEREALETFRRVYGPDHDRVGLAAYNLGKTLERMGRYAEADSLLRVSVRIDRKTYGRHSTGVGMDLRWLGSILREEGDCESAVHALREADAIFEGDGRPPEERWRLRVRADLGGCLATLGDRAEAEQILKKDYAAGMAAGADVDSVGFRSTLQSLVSLYDAWGRLEEAEVYRTQLRGR